MKAWIVRFASLYVFDVVVLIVIGILLPTVRVGWSVLWAALILTAATIWLKPLLARLLGGAAERSAQSRTRAGQTVVTYGTVFLVELIVWIVLVMLSGIRVGGFFWGWILPPLLLLVAWAVYDAIDDRLQRTAGDLYDRATGRGDAAVETSATGVTATSATTTVTVEPDDGLTPEQRRMLDELG